MSENLLTLRAEVEIQAADNGRKIPRVEILAYSGGEFSPGGWPNCCIDLAGADLGDTIPLLAGHADELDSIVGQGTANVQNGKLFVRGTLTEATGSGQKVLALARSGVSLQASVGYQPGTIERIKPNTSVVVNNRTLKAGPNGLTIIRSGRLREVSLLPIGADSNTTVTIAAKRGEIQKGTKRMSTIKDPLDDPSSPERKKIDAECGRLFGLDETGLTDSQKIVARWSKAQFKTPLIRQQTESYLHAALAGEIDLTQFENELLKAQNRDLNLQVIHAGMQAAPAVHGSSLDRAGTGSPTSVLQGAFLAHLGHEDMGVKALGEQTMQRARDLRATSMMDILKAGLEFAHVDAPPTRDGMIRAAFSTHSITTMLSDSANKLLLRAYAAFPSAARMIARKLSTNDFKTHTGYRITGDAKMKELAGAGEIKHGTLGQDSYNFAVKTYARMFSLTRTDIINDDLGAFDEVPRMLGRGAALTIEELFWTLVLANTGSYFHGDNANLITGALSLESLGDAVSTMMNAVDQDGHPVNVVPRFLVVPPALKALADSLYRSTTVVATGSTDTRTPAGNTFFGMYEPVASPYISNASFSGNSATQWYLFGDPGDVAAFGLAYLSGQENPVVEQSDVDFNKLGISYRGYIDVGVCQIDHRGAVKSTGVGDE